MPGTVVLLQFTYLGFAENEGTEKQMETTITCRI